MGSSELLPEDVLADVLRRLAPRWLATSRRVCRAWRATVDNRGLLSAVANLLPRSVAGIFIDTNYGSFFLARPSVGPMISADLSYTFPSGGNGYMIDDSFEVRDHRNGLVLLHKDQNHCVVINPATQQWAHLPPRPPLPCVGSPDYFYADEYLVYDPTESPHYEVFSIPRIRRQYELEPRHRREGQILSFEGSPFTFKELDPALEELEWPPSPFVLRVFSSRTGRWEKRSFVREGVAAGTIAHMRIDPYVAHRYAVCWQGALYVQCQTDFIMRLSLSSEKYQLIQPPVTFEPYHGGGPSPYATRLSIGKSEKGVYSVLIRGSQIKVWILDDSGGQIKWVSKQLVADLPKLEDKIYYKLESHGSWVLQDVDSRFDAAQGYVNSVTPEQFEWDSDDDDLLPDNGNRTGYKYYITFMGFHPYKEVIFLNDSFVRVLAFHLNSSKTQDLGYVYPEKDVHYFGNDLVLVERAFPYTPCWMRDFPSKCLI